MNESDEVATFRAKANAGDAAAPFKGLHAGGPDALFAGQDNVIKGIFTTLETLHANLQARAG